MAIRRKSKSDRLDASFNKVTLNNEKIFFPTSFIMRATNDCSISRD
jgi:hypothetical protein